MLGTAKVVQSFDLDYVGLVSAILPTHFNRWQYVTIDPNMVIMTELTATVIASIEFHGEKFVIALFVCMRSSDSMGIRNN